VNNLITPRALSSLHSRKAALYFIKVDRITHSRLQTPVSGLYSFEIIQDGAWPPLGFGLTESRSIRTADSENPIPWSQKWSVSDDPSLRYRLSKFLKWEFGRRSVVKIRTHYLHGSYIILFATLKT